MIGLRLHRFSHLLAFTSAMIPGRNLCRSSRKMPGKSWKRYKKGVTEITEGRTGCFMKSVTDSGISLPFCLMADRQKGDVVY